MVGSQVGHPSVTGAARCEGALVPAVKISGGARVTARVLLNGQTGKLP